jgi:hypothetical protein
MPFYCLKVEMTPKQLCLGVGFSALKDFYRHAPKIRKEDL